jgi:hypothetical protein
LQVAKKAFKIWLLCVKKEFLQEKHAKNIANNPAFKSFLAFLFGCIPSVLP